jgi:hypothetical protein
MTINRSDIVSHQRPQRGSALLLTVVLTSLLAIVGVLFVMSTRLDKIGSVATGQSKQLDMAVDAVLDELTEQLVLDVPGVAGQEYYDAADANDPWLSSIEPFVDGNNFYWPQVTNLQGHSTLFEIDFVEDREVIADVDPNTGAILTDQKADADGDGLTDTYWFKLDGFGSSRNKPIYAAVRVVDHGSMYNVNTAFQDMPSPGDFDQPSPMQINIVDLFSETDAVQLQAARTNALNPQAYLEDVVWNFGPLDPNHHPFDIQDELELRSRYLINNKSILSRIEVTDEDQRGWGELYDTGFYTPQYSDLSNWFRHAVYDSNDTAAYDYRHITTTVNLDRVINPDGLKMVDVNQPSSLQALYEAIKNGLSPAIDPNDRQSQAAQIAINLWDFQDGDTEPGVIYLSDVERNAVPSTISNAYYGFEVHPYISEVAYQVDADDLNKVEVYIELYNPSLSDLVLDDVSLLVYDSTNDQVIHQIDLPANTGIDSNSMYTVTLGNSANPLDAASMPVVVNEGIVTAYYDIYLVHQIHDANLYLDVFKGESWSDTNDTFSDSNEPTPDVWHSMARDTRGWQVAYQVSQYSTNPTRDSFNDGVTVEGRSLFTVLDPSDEWDDLLKRSSLKNIGQIGRLLRVGPASEPNVPFATIGQQLTDPDLGVEHVFVNLTNQHYANLFQYLTLLTAENYGLSNETRVKGRININTAPWVVLQGLPGFDQVPDPNRIPAKSIALYREQDPNHVYQSVGDLMQVQDMLALGLDSDGLLNLEQRDQIFTRLADLATVRSDVFTAYILVRMGVNGPQKRAIAVLDRSHVDDARDKIRVVALQPVPESR